MSDADQDPQGRTVIAAETDGAGGDAVPMPRREGGIATGDLLNHSWIRRSPARQPPKRLPLFSPRELQLSWNLGLLDGIS